MKGLRLVIKVSSSKECAGQQKFHRLPEDWMVSTSLIKHSEVGDVIDGAFKLWIEQLPEEARHELSAGEGSQRKATGIQLKGFYVGKASWLLLSPETIYGIRHLGVKFRSVFPAVRSKWPNIVGNDKDLEAYSIRRSAQRGALQKHEIQEFQRRCISKRIIAEGSDIDPKNLSRASQ
eukprot:jgi/Psemu1/27246/gm1.27246_g